MTDSLNRRDFEKLSSAGIAAASLSGTTSAQTPRGANEKIVVALIGCGGRGMSDADRFKNLPNVEVAFVGDWDDEANQLIRREYRDHWGTPRDV